MTKVDLFFNNAPIGSCEDEEHAIKKFVAAHIGTWAGNGVTAKILGRRPVAALYVSGWILEVESTHGMLYTIHTYRVSKSRA